MSSPDSGATGTDQADDEALQQLRDLGAQQEGSAASEPTRARAGRRASPGSSSSSNALPANDCEASADHGHFDHTSRPTPAPAVSNSPFPAAPTPPGAMSGMPPYVLAGHRAHSEGPSAWRGRPAADIASMNSGIVIGSAMQVKGFGRRRPFNIPSAEGDLVPGEFFAECKTLYLLVFRIGMPFPRACKGSFCAGGTGGDAMPVHREESCRDLVAPMVVTPILHRRASGRAGRPGPSVVPQMAAFVPVEAE